MIDEKVHIAERVANLRKRAAERCNIEESECHIGHISLQAMLDEPSKTLQIDAATGGTETYKSVARRTCRLASAMTNSGMKPGDAVVLISNNNLDLCIPYYACHFNGYSMCAVDISLGPDDLSRIFPFIQPRMIFSIKSCADKISQALKVNKLKTEVVIFDDKTADLEVFVGNYFGTQVNFRPPVFNQSETIACLMLTSGTTGSPKVAMISFDTLLNGMIQWWRPFSDKVERVMALVTLQWLSSLVFFSATTLRGYTRVQSSEQLTPQKLIALINTYRPNGTAWSPYLLGQFIAAAHKHVDMSCFRYIIIGGSAIDKPLLDQVKSICPASLYLVYGMTELLVPVFDYDNDTPFGSTGKPLSQYEFKIMDDNNQTLIKPFKTGELWIKGGSAFFKGYLNNPEETATLLTNDGWFKTGDMFYRDDQDYYYFVERKRLIIKHFGFKLSPLQMEEIVKRHPGVEEACVVGLPDGVCLERPVAAILKRSGKEVEPKEIFALWKAENITNAKKLMTGVFFVDSFPVTPSGKIHRSKVKDMALRAEKILDEDSA